MSSSKRDHSPDELDGHPRHTKTARVVDGGEAKVQHTDEVRITAHELSRSKAMCNDPLPFGFDHSPELPPVVEGPDIIHHVVRRQAASILGQNSRRGGAETYDTDNQSDGSSVSIDSTGANPDVKVFSDGGNYKGFDEFVDLGWLEQLDASGFVDDRRIARCRAKLVRRREMLGSFWTNMEGISCDVTSTALGLFDRCGRLKRDLYEHEVRRGTGVWGPELDRGDILLFEVIAVKAPWRRQHIASKLVGAILNLTRRKSPNFVAIASSGLLRHEKMLGNQHEDPEVREKALEITGDFWRSLGFRRVGITRELAFTDDASHPSRHLVAALDCEQPEISKDDWELPGILAYVVEGLRSRNVSGAECVRRISRALPEQEWAQAWLMITDTGYNTILHTAFEGGKPEAISYILSACPRLANERNNFGYTPIQWAGVQMEIARSHRHDKFLIRDRAASFEGFEYNVLASLAALKGIEIADLRKLTERDVEKVWLKDDEANDGPEATLIRTTLRMKYGCTCGYCIGGFLSPRMRFTLLSVARTIETFLDWDLHSQSWEDLSKDATRSLPRVVRMYMAQFKTLRQGFVAMYRHVACCLEDDQLPTWTNVQGYYGGATQESQRVTRSYLRYGGTVGAVVVSIIEASMSWDEWMGNKRNARNSLEGIDALPPCRNDHEFEFVSGMCGYKRKYCLKAEWWN